ncbi:hypothetical protein MPSEU_000499300 [Mayamaea pseudoterrestris]|nr:hypothetical protein MPSEU_000499300 [Mayamaea pseudoterrestris]
MKDKEEPECIVDFAAVEELTSLTGVREQQEIQRADPMHSGFMWYVPPLAVSRLQHESGGHDWIISGHDMQVLTATVSPGETVTTEVGSFVYGSGDIETKVELTCFGSGGCSEGWNRICGGESCAKVLLTNKGMEEGYVGLTPPYPAKIVPLQFGKHIQENHALIAQPGVYMSQLGKVYVACDLDCSPTTCCCAGFGCCRQKITGNKDSIAFLSAGGTIVYRQLADNETITVDSRSIVAVEESVSLGITPNGRLCVCCLGGEGCFSTTLTGPGKVFMQVCTCNVICVTPLFTSPEVCSTFRSQ